VFTSDLRICSSCPTYSTGIVPYRIAHLQLSSKRRTLWCLRIFVHIESRAMFPNDASYICSPQRYSTYIGSFRLAHLQQSTTLQCRHCSIPTCACAAGEGVACLGSPGAVATDLRRAGTCWHGSAIYSQEVQTITWIHGRSIINWVCIAFSTQKRESRGAVALCCRVYRSHWPPLLF
jgi:hypothetical protein